MLFPVEIKIFRDFEFGMFPKGDPALKEFIPGKYKIKIPSFSFDTTKDKEIGTFLEPVIEKKKNWMRSN